MTYDDAARARWVPEKLKPSWRSEFERDRGRVLHSAALRRLAAKTQVVGPSTDDFVRNRLTHSLEVAQIARSLGGALGCDPDVVETAALAHDLGHPPFGHNGETALAELAESCGGFEGNAQTLRVLTRLEAKREGAGLNLTRASLDAATKYPWPASDRDTKKYGVYADDVPVFAWIREGAPDRVRCVEAQVMDLADDVAYSVHDLEDGIVAGRIGTAPFTDIGARRELWETTREWYLPGVTDEELEAAVARLAELPSWPGAAPYDGTRGAMAALKDLGSDLIGRWVGAVQRATYEPARPGPLTRYDADVVVPAETALEIVVLKGLAAHYVMRADDRVDIMTGERALIVELVEALVARGPEALEPAFRGDYAGAADAAARLRVVVDQVASLTDVSARHWHGRLT